MGEELKSRKSRGVRIGSSRSGHRPGSLKHRLSPISCGCEQRIDACCLPGLKTAKRKKTREKSTVGYGHGSVRDEMSQQRSSNRRFHLRPILSSPQPTPRGCLPCRTKSPYHRIPCNRSSQVPAARRCGLIRPCLLNFPSPSLSAAEGREQPITKMDAQGDIGIKDKLAIYVYGEEDCLPA